MPGIRYPVSKPCITSREERYVLEALRSGWISSMGPFVEQFEDRFARFCGVTHGIAVCNGTAALHLAIRALDIGPDDEIIVPDLSFIATANAVLMAGAKPIFCDIDHETLCLDPSTIEKKITRSTKAIIPVHLYGHPAETDRIGAIAKSRGLKVIEDAAEAHGARVRGRLVGSFGDCAAFSFYGNKIISTGEGGMITTDDAELASRCKFLRDQAMRKTRRYWHETLGYNYRITNLQAALGCAQMDRLEEFIRGRDEIFEWYLARLQHEPDINLSRTAPWASRVYWMVCAEFPRITESKRDMLIQRLLVRGIETRPYFYPMSDMPYMTASDTPRAHNVSKIGINLPTYIGLTRDDIDRICADLVAELHML